jgi:hypothetical protein
MRFVSLTLFLVPFGMRFVPFRCIIVHSWAGQSRYLNQARADLPEFPIQFLSKIRREPVHQAVKKLQSKAIYLRYRSHLSSVAL